MFNDSHWHLFPFVFVQVVRSYKEPHYILDSGGHVKGTRGLSAYLLNNNLYFSVAMSTDEDTLTWTVRTSIFTVRWVPVSLRWFGDFNFYYFKARNVSLRGQNPSSSLFSPAFW